jgi:anti-anti-sigma factor
VDIVERRIADVVVVAPAGQIDHPNAQRLERALAPVVAPDAAGLRALVLDFRNVGYVSSMGLRVLMVAAKALRARNSRIAVAGLQPVVAEIFDIARFTHVLEVFPSVRDALAATSAPALAAWDAAP